MDFILSYNGEAGQEVSGGCTGLLIYFCMFSVCCGVRDGCAVWYKCLLFFIMVYNWEVGANLSGGCIVDC